MWFKFLRSSAGKSFVTFVLLILCFGCTQKTQITTDRRWQFEQVAKDEKLTGLVGMALDNEGLAHIVFGSADGIKYASPASSGWNVAEIDMPPDEITSVSNLDFALDGKGNPHIIFCGQLKKGNSSGFEGILYYGFKSGRRWSFGRVASGAFGGALIMDSSNQPVIAFISVDREVRLARVKAKKWQFEEIYENDLGEQLKRNASSRPSLRIDSKGMLYCAYFSPKEKAVFLSKRGRSGWQKEKAYKSDVMESAMVSLALDGSGNPAITFEPSESGGTGFVQKRGGLWKTREIESSGEMCPVTNSDRSGNISLASFKYAYRGLVFRQLQADEFLSMDVEIKKGERFFQVRPQNITLAFDEKNRPIIAYSDPARQIICYFRKTRR